MGRVMLQKQAALAVLALVASGCAMTEEYSPELARGPVTPAPVVEAAAPAPEAPSDESDMIEQSDAHWAEQPPVEEPRTPIKDVLLKESATAGQRTKYVVKSGESLAKIARRNRLTLPLLELANHLKSDRIRAGQKLTIPEMALRIEIDKSANELALFNGPQVARTYRVATGDQGVTPVGSYTIANRLIGPTWYWEGREYKADDPDYPLGSRWMGLSRRGYGIHGTNEPELIGQQVSHGCIRMLNEDVEELFDVVAEGTPVSIIE